MNWFKDTEYIVEGLAVLVVQTLPNDQAYRYVYKGGYKGWCADRVSGYVIVYCTFQGLDYPRQTF